MARFIMKKGSLCIYAQAAGRRQLHCRLRLALYLQLGRVRHASCSDWRLAPGAPLTELLYSRGVKPRLAPQHVVSVAATACGFHS